MAGRTGQGHEDDGSELARPKREFTRSLWGYSRSEVDDQLAGIDATIAELQLAIDRAVTPTDQHDLVLRATRRSVEEVMERAQAEADAIRSEAKAAASQLLADAYQLVRARDGAVIDLRAEAADSTTSREDLEADLFAPDTTDS